MVTDLKMEKIYEYHKPEHIIKLFDDNHSEEVINKIKNFYFKGNNLENNQTKLENTCHVSTFH